MCGSMIESATSIASRPDVSSNSILISNNLDFTKPVQIAPDIYWVGIYLENDPFQCHPYFINNGKESILIDPGSMLQQEDIIKKIQCDADGQCAMEVILSGVKRPDLTLDVSVLEEELSEHFFQILVKDKTTVSLDDIDEASIPEQLVYGQFVRRMKQQLQEAETEEQRKVVETALQIGIAHLAGKDD